VNEKNKVLSDDESLYDGGWMDLPSAHVKRLSDYLKGKETTRHDNHKKKKRDKTQQSEQAEWSGSEKHARRQK
jgi:hypothetical protein